MIKRSVKLFLLIACPLIMWACNDDLTICNDVSLDKGTNVIVIDGEDGYFTLPIDTTAIASVSLIEGDFLNNLGYGRLYFEQNDLSENRMAQVKVKYLDGKDSTFVIRQRPFTRTNENGMRQFYRHHGIGYSYDASEGDYCNPKNFKCQILNRAVIDSLKEHITLVKTDSITDLHYYGTVYSSFEEYVQGTSFCLGIGASIEIASFNLEKTSTLYEDATVDSYIFQQNVAIDRFRYGLICNEIAMWTEDCPNLLTSSFQQAIMKLKTDASNKAIDDFIYRYGSHLVTDVLLGARLSLTIQAKTTKFYVEKTDSLIIEGKIASLFKAKMEKSTDESKYSVLNDSKCIYDVVGGNIEALGNLVSSTKFDNSIDVVPMIEKWIEPIEKDENASELIRMTIIPIWTLISDEDIANRVEARVTGNYSKLLESLGNKNFINSSFVAHPTEVTCYLGNSTTNKKEKKTFQTPETVDIIASNRHVATICKEYVPEITPSEKVYVAYPIYEGKVKLTDGLCIHNGKAYDVDWRYNCFKITERDDNVPLSDNIYINYGVLSTFPINVSYQTSHQILGCERPGGIQYNGKIGGEMVPVFKHFGHFYLDNLKEYDNLPGWSYIRTEMEEASNYKTYFPENVYSNRMVRNNDYIYIYNTTEISYE